jgi:hypothetical protein
VNVPIGFDEIQVEDIAAGKVISLKFKEKLRKEDYEKFVPMLESQMGGDQKIRILVQLHDFEGWTVGALWEDTKFAARHFTDIEKLAVVGDAKWQKGLTVFAKPFTAATVRYFKMEDIEKARRWIHTA